MNKKILLTRPRGDSDGLSGVLKEKGFDVHIEPMLDIQLYSNSQELNMALSESPQAIIVTSANGIRAFANVSNARNHKIITVGNSSCNEAIKLGFTDVISSAPDGKLGDLSSLCSYIYANIDKNSGSILYISGAKISENIHMQLEGQGYDVKRVVLYDASANKEMSQELQALIQDDNINAVFFYSQRTAKNFIKLLYDNKLYRRTNNMYAFCLSENIKEALSGAPFKGVFISPFSKSDLLYMLLGKI